MTIYNFNLGIGWASSGVEYAQIYRAEAFRKIGVEAKFIFTDMIKNENIQRLTANIGFRDEEVIWLYSYFTDFRIAPSTYPRSRWEETLQGETYEVEERDDHWVYLFRDQNRYVNVYPVSEGSPYIRKTEFVCGGYMVRADYYTYKRMFSEYYAPKDGRAELYLRQYYHTDGSLAYEEMWEGGQEIYRLPDCVCYSKEEFVSHFIRSLGMTRDDIIILDRSAEIGQAVFRNRGEAKLGIVIHADHYNKRLTDEENILWNNHYEYDFAWSRDVDFYIASTDAQNEILTRQFQQYTDHVPYIATVSVGNLKTLMRPRGPRMRYSIITASRLAEEKHIDWMVKAVILAHEKVPELNFHIYGRGAKAKLAKQLIQEGNAQDYIRLMGHHHLKEIYQRYEVYLSASGSEGFGLTLMEAVGSGLPLIGFDVPYGNQTFVEEGKNGYLIDYPQDAEVLIRELADRIVRMFTETDIEAFSQHSYQVAEKYLLDPVAEDWRALLERIQTPMRTEKEAFAQGR